MTNYFVTAKRQFTFQVFLRLKISFIGISEDEIGTMSLTSDDADGGEMPAYCFHLFTTLRNDHEIANDCIGHIF